MITTFPAEKLRIPLGLTQAILIAGLVLSPALIKLQIDHHSRAQTMSEFQATRQSLFSQIEDAAADHDLDTLIAIERKYAGCVSDTRFTATLQNALARATAHKKELELTVSRHLDLARHQEETRRNSNQTRTQVSAGNQGTQQLSILPQ